MKLVHFLSAACGAAAVAAACSANSPADTSGDGGVSGGTGGVGSGGTGGTLATGGSAGSAGNGGTLTIIGAGADSTSPGKFGGGDDPSGTITIEYPRSGVVVPPNMNAIEIHYLPGAGQTLFEFTFAAAAQTYVEYVGCTPLDQGCVYTPSKEFWTVLADRVKGGDAVSWSVRGVDGATPGAVGKSAARELWVAQEALTAGIYYWNTKGAIQRYDWGYPLQQAENFLRPGAQTGAGFCIGCHALSHDGNTIAFGKDLPNASPFAVFDVATRTTRTAAGAPITGNSEAFYSFSPDGSKMIMGNGKDLDELDVVTGMLRTGLLKGTMPDWSPDGQTLAYALSDLNIPLATATCSSCSIAIAHYSAGAWVNPEKIVPFDGQNNYYPTFSPSGDFILFNRSPAGHDNFTNAVSDSEAGLPDGRLWAVLAQGGSQPIALVTAHEAEPTSWPKWAPGTYTYNHGRPIMWFTFSSLGAFGLRLHTYQRTQLWMAAFDLGDAQAGSDPSRPAFWLPFQDINGGNHIAQWVTSVQRQPCQRVEDCQAGESCIAGDCYPEDVH